VQKTRFSTGTNHESSRHNMTLHNHKFCSILAASVVHCSTAITTSACCIHVIAMNNSRAVASSSHHNSMSLSSSDKEYIIPSETSSGDIEELKPSLTLSRRCNIQIFNPSPKQK
jgi:hypothetical protein